MKDELGYACKANPTVLAMAWMISGNPQSAVGMATGYGLHDRGVKNFLFSTSSRPAPGPIQPPVQWVPEALFPGVKRQGREAEHSSPTSAEVKKMWIYTSTPPYVYKA
jgi:hypothetical protein